MKAPPVKQMITVKEILAAGVIDSLYGQHTETPGQEIGLAGFVFGLVCYGCPANCTQIDLKTGKAYVEPLSKERNCGVGV